MPREITLIVCGKCLSTAKFKHYHGGVPVPAMENPLPTMNLVPRVRPCMVMWAFLIYLLAWKSLKRYFCSSMTRIGLIQPEKRWRSWHRSNAAHTTLQILSLAIKQTPCMPQIVSPDLSIPNSLYTLPQL